MKTANIAEAKSHFSALLADVEVGEEAIITRRGKPIARIVAEFHTESTAFDLSALRDFAEPQPSRKPVRGGHAPTGDTVICLNTSAVGCLFFREPAEYPVLARLKFTDDDILCVSVWTPAEMASVGAIEERAGNVDAAGRAAGLAAFHRFVSDSLTLPEVEPTDFRTAAVLLDTPSLALRAGDASHITIAPRNRCQPGNAQHARGRKLRIMGKGRAYLAILNSRPRLISAKGGGSIPGAASTLQSLFPKCPVVRVFINHA